MITLVRMVAWFLGVLPLWLAMGIGSGAGRLAGAVMRKRTRLAGEALRLSFPEASPEAIRGILRDMYRHFGFVAVECLRSISKQQVEFEHQVEWEGLENVPRDENGYRPCLVLTGHIGNWELLGLAAGRLGVTINAVVRSFKDREFEQFWNESREKVFGLSLLTAANSFRACLKALRRGEMVTVLLDQHAIPREGLVVDFFGRPASTHPGLALLAAHTQLPVVPAFMERRAPGRHTAHVLPAVPPPPDSSFESIREATQQYTRIIEDFVREHPAQWIWPHGRWKVKEGGAQTVQPGGAGLPAGEHEQSVQGS